jgi:hypothetical protein
LVELSKTPTFLSGVMVEMQVEEGHAFCEFLKYFSSNFQAYSLISLLFD